MKFYNRQDELKILQQHDQLADQQGVMTVLTGRRRVGKTALALNFPNDPLLYFFITKKSEPLLCDEFLDEIKQRFQIPLIGEIKAFQDIFALLLEISKKQKLTVIIDEFQEFYYSNPAIYSEIQKLWDLNKKHCRIHVILIGSVYSLMCKIFEHAKEPLFGRADTIIHLQPFTIHTLAHILEDYGIASPRNLLDFYAITGNMPRYLELFLNNQAYDKAAMIQAILRPHSVFLNEGKNVLIEEFGREYGTYFSILELIASGKTARSEIEPIIEKPIGGHLQRLENDYAVIKPVMPVQNKKMGRLKRYQFVDNFLFFWFRFIYRYRSAIEMGNFGFVHHMFERDYPSFCGRILERLFHALLAETGQYNRIGSYWERGHKNEIDIVAINDQDKTMLIAETKLNRDKISLTRVQSKAASLIQYYTDYKIEFKALSIEDILGYLM